MNCIIVDDDAVSRTVLEHFVRQTQFLHLVHSFADAIAAANLLMTDKVDLIFLDIQMPEMSGMEFIKNLMTNPQIVLITSHEDYAIEAFEYDVTDYLVKPISAARFLKAALKAKERFNKEQSQPPSNKYIFVKVDSRLVKLNTMEIFWVEALGDYMVIKTAKETLTTHATMKSIESKLSNHEFIRVHRSFIVRLDKIAYIEDNAIVILDKVIPLGKAHKDELTKRLNLL